jgi:hypothetical protein
MALRYFYPFLIMAVFISLAAVHPESKNNIITKENQRGVQTELIVGVHMNAAKNFLTFDISIPKDDHRLKRLFRAEFVLGTLGHPSPARLTVPMDIKKNPDGSRVIAVGVDASTVQDSFIQFSCYWENPALSSIDVVFLQMDSYLAHKK